jgi:hypothetical protein
MKEKKSRVGFRHDQRYVRAFILLPENTPHEAVMSSEPKGVYHVEHRLIFNNFRNIRPGLVKHKIFYTVHTEEGKQNLTDRHQKKKNR